MKSIEERRQRFSLTLLFSGLVFVFLVGTMIVVSLIIVLLIHVGILQLGESSIRTGSFILIIALASIVIGTGLSATVGRYPLRSINHIIKPAAEIRDGTVGGDGFESLPAGWPHYAETHGTRTREDGSLHGVAGGLRGAGASA